jgi:hypothetical protein
MTNVIRNPFTGLNVSREKRSRQFPNNFVGRRSDGAGKRRSKKKLQRNSQRWFPHDFSVECAGQFSVLW